MDSKIKQCLNFVQYSYKNKLLNTLLKQDIEELEKTTPFEYPEQFYEKNDHIVVAYNELKKLNEIKIEKEKMGMVCPKCKSDNIIIRYSQMLHGDEVETQEIFCNFCGGSFTNL